MGVLEFRRVRRALSHARLAGARGRLSPPPDAGEPGLRTTRIDGHVEPGILDRFHLPPVAEAGAYLCLRQPSRDPIGLRAITEAEHVIAGSDPHDGTEALDEAWAVLGLEDVKQAAVDDGDGAAASVMCSLLPPDLCPHLVWAVIVSVAAMVLDRRVPSDPVSTSWQPARGAADRAARLQTPRRRAAPGGPRRTDREASALGM